jgi:N6-adenosine-specific RNA methylase IME4
MHSGVTLTDAIRRFPTPSATQYGSAQNGINGRGGEFERPSAGTPSLETMARRGLLPSRPVPQTQRDGHDSSPPFRVLNPAFVEMLMGWEPGWTAFGSVETASSRNRQPSPSRSSTDDSVVTAMTDDRVLSTNLEAAAKAERSRCIAEAMKRARWAPIVKGTYRVVLADPPWKFRDQASRIAPSHAGTGRRDARYQQVPDNQRIKDMGDFVWELGAKDSFLFLWAPNAIVVDGTATEVCRLWGYEPKQLIPWVKTGKDGSPRLGGGHYTRVCTEQLILATRGRPRVMSRSIPGVILAPRTAHSAKPDEAYELIERLALGPYIELFARRRWNERWAVLGNQIADKVTLC